MEKNIRMTVRLQIVYGRLSINSVRGAFEESVGSRLLKFGGYENKELFQRFTSQFKDDIKLPRGSIIELSRDLDYILHTTIDGKEVGSIQCKLLCRSILDLYIGDESFDHKANEDVESNLASLLLNTTVIGGTVYNVGDSGGWSGDNVDFHMWASTKTFQVGDTLVFKYNQQFHNVVQVSLSDFHSAMTRLLSMAPATTTISVVSQAAGQKVDMRVPKANHIHSRSATKAPVEAFQRETTRVLTK